MRYSDLTETTIKLRGFKVSDDAGDLEGFLDEFHSESEENPLSPHKRVFHNCVVKIGKFGSAIQLDDIRSIRPGAGTIAMKAICELADRYGVRINLYAKGYSDTPTDFLVTWYQRFGFQVDDSVINDEGVDMYRKPI